MKLVSLGLDAHGPFTHMTIDLGAHGRPGLHLLWAENGGGKTTTCRAIADLLFGYQQRTRDNFLHPYEDLRLSARVEVGGRTLDLVRRKRRKDALLDGAEQPLDPAVLDPALRGLDRERFFREACLDHAALVQGAQALLSGQGDVGQALFAASMATEGARKLLTELSRDADKILQEQRRIAGQVLRAAVETWKEKQDAARKAALDGKALQDAGLAMVEARERLQKVTAEHRAARLEAARGVRLQRALPLLGRRRVVAVELERLQAEGPVPALRAGFDEERRRLESGRDLASQRGGDAAAARHKVMAQLEELTVDDPLLGRAVEVEALVPRLELVRQGGVRRGELEVSLQSLGREVVALANGLAPGAKPDEVARAMPRVGLRGRVDDLVQERAGFAAELEVAAKATDRERLAVRHERETLAALAAPVPVDGLRLAIHAGRALGEIDRALAADGHALATERKALEAERARLRDAPALDEVSSFVTPELATVEVFGERYAWLEEQERGLASRSAEAQTALEAVDLELDALGRAGAVPLESDLDQARAERAGQWSVVLSSWSAGAVVEEGRPAIAAFEGAVDAADGVADRLRREADRVAARAQALARRDQLAQRMALIAEERRALEATRESLDDDWAATWAASDLTPRTPREMRAWLDRLERLRTRVADHARGTADLEARVEARAGAIVGLCAALAACGVPCSLEGQKELAPVLARADARLSELEGLERRRHEIERAVAQHVQAEGDAAHERLQAEGRLDAWRGRWAAACTEAGLPVDASPAEVRRTLEGFAALRARLDQARAAREELEQLVCKQAGFEAEVRRLVEVAAPDLAGVAPLEAAGALGRRLEVARRTSERRDGLLARAEDLDNQASVAARDLATSVAALARLCTEAGAAGPEALPALIARTDEVARLRAELARVEEDLRADVGAEGSSEGLATEAAGLQPDELRLRVDEMERGVEALETARSNADQELGARTNALAQLEASGGAAEAAQEAQEAAARVHELELTWLHRTRARAVLALPIARFRARHEGPILQRAGELFAQFTLGEFTGVGTRDAEGGPVVVAMTASGKERAVEVLSDGEREQLFLALRLACVQRALDTLEPGTEPLPLVVDDVLLRSDERRSRAVLSALADLGERLQVLVLTHRQGVAAQARALAAERPGEVFVHVLGAPAAPTLAATVSVAAA